MPDVHALLNASGAKKWLSCPPSARLEEKLPDRSSSYADEGTFGHSFAEWKLRTYYLEAVPKSKKEQELSKFQESEYYSKELEEAVDRYVDLIKENYNAQVGKFDHQNVLLILEKCLDFSDFAPEGFGTGDTLILSPESILVFDLKLGKGVMVSGENNPQMRLYGLGALKYLEVSKNEALKEFNQDLITHELLDEKPEDLFPILKIDPQSISTMIIQPRLENFTGENMTIKELLAWGESIKPIAAQAWAGKGEFQSGDHCRWCKVRGNCKARANQNLDLVKQYNLSNPALLTLQELGEILKRVDNFSSWAKDVSDFSLMEAKNGSKIPGFKLVEGRSNRKIKDEEKAKKLLRSINLKDEQFLKPQTMQGLTELEKLVGKKKLNDLFASIIEKPPGAPTLAPETDKRPEISHTAQAQEVFNLLEALD